MFSLAVWIVFYKDSFVLSRRAASHGEFSPIKSLQAVIREKLLLLGEDNACGSCHNSGCGNDTGICGYGRFSGSLGINGNFCFRSIRNNSRLTVDGVDGVNKVIGCGCVNLRTGNDEICSTIGRDVRQVEVAAADDVVDNELIGVVGGFENFDNQRFTLCEGECFVIGGSDQREAVGTECLELIVCKTDEVDNTGVVGEVVTCKEQLGLCEEVDREPAVLVAFRELVERVFNTCAVQFDRNEVCSTAPVFTGLVYFNAYAFTYCSSIRFSTTSSNCFSMLLAFFS